ncbi:hypothetical protein [Phenylobacterium sp.]|uniref:hypothetical protein n=1 Tax=Phenylobacterium sp. TaxID=1871053 RepID=UPI0035AE51A6
MTLYIFGGLFLAIAGVCLWLAPQYRADGDDAEARAAMGGVVAFLALGLVFLVAATSFTFAQGDDGRGGDVDPRPRQRAAHAANWARSRNLSGGQRARIRVRRRTAPGEGERRLARSAGPARVEAAAFRVRRGWAGARGGPPAALTG